MTEFKEVQDIRVSKDRSDFNVYRSGVTVEFSKELDGEFYIAIDGYQMESFRMTAEQFAAFKEWIKEN